MSTTAFPAIVAGLISQFGASTALTDVRIFDGPEIDESYPGDAIAIGHDGTDDGDITAGSATQQFLELGNRKQFEDGSINCSLWSWNGGTTLTDRRVRAYELFSALDTALRTDVSVGGSCLYSTIDQHTVAYRQTNAGALVLINFSITYRAKT